MARAGTAAALKVKKLLASYYKGKFEVQNELTKNLINNLAPIWLDVIRIEVEEFDDPKNVELKFYLSRDEYTRLRADVIDLYEGLLQKNKLEEDSITECELREK